MLIRIAKMARLKRFKTAPPDAKNLLPNKIGFVQPSLFRTNSGASRGSAYDESGFVQPTLSGDHSGPSIGSGHGGVCPVQAVQSAVHSGAHGGTTSVQPTCSGTYSGPSNGSLHGRGSSDQAMRSGAHGEAHSHSSPSNGIRHGGVGSSSSDSYHMPEYTDSSNESSDGDLIPPSSRAATKNNKKKSYWIVKLIDGDGNITEGHLKVQNVWTLAKGKKIILPCNERHQPIDDAGAILGWFLGDLASDFTKFPLCYRTWRKVPTKYKNRVYDDIIENKFQVEVYRTKEWIIQNLGKKWKSARNALFNKFTSESLTVEQNIARRPIGIDADQWTWFIHYRNEKKTKAMCAINAENRKKLLYPHTTGAKSFARKEVEEKRQRQKPISRGEFWIITRKGKDGCYTNEAAKIIGEKIEEAERQEGCPTHISPNDSLGQVLGKEYPGRVRGLGFGPCPSQVFGQTTHRFNGTSSAQFGSDPKMEEMKLKMQKLEAMVESERSRRQTFEIIHRIFNPTKWSNSA